MSKETNKTSELVWGFKSRLSQVSDFMVPNLSTTSRCSVHSEARGLLNLRV